MDAVDGTDVVERCIELIVVFGFCTECCVCETVFCTECCVCCEFAMSVVSEWCAEFNVSMLNRLTVRNLVDDRWRSS